MVLPFAQGRWGRSKEGKRQRGGDREGEKGPRSFQLLTVLSRATLMDLKAALRQSSGAASCLGTWSEKTYLIRSTCRPYLSTWVKDVFSPTVKLFVISVQSLWRPPNSIPTGIKIQSMSLLGVSWEKRQTDQTQTGKLKKPRFFPCITVSICEDMQIKELLFIVPKALKPLALTQREPVPLTL